MAYGQLVSNSLSFELKVKDQNILVDRFSDATGVNSQDFALRFYKESSGENVPGVYCIFNGKFFYIGQSMEPYSRVKHHWSTGRIDGKFSTLIFQSPQFSQSSIYDIETTLINYASADRKRSTVRMLKNANLNQASKRYFLKDQYEPIADVLWDSLLGNGLGTSTSQAIRETTEYRLSPFMALNLEQRTIVSQLLGDAAFPSDNGSAEEGRVLAERLPLMDGISIVEGFPGTGKSVIASAIYSQVIRSHKGCIVAATTQTYGELKKVFSGKYSKLFEVSYKPVVLTPTQLVRRLKAGESFDVIVIDEAHRLVKSPDRGMPERLRHVKESGVGEIELIAKLCGYKGLVLMYDSNQVVHPNDYESLAFPYAKNVSRFELQHQERLLAGSGYSLSLFSFLENRKNDSEYDLDGYDFRIYRSFRQMRDELILLTSKGKHCYLTAGYTRKWDRLKRGEPEFNIEGLHLRWNTEKTKDWTKSLAAKNLNEIGYYEFVQGLDADYSGVIIGKDLTFRDGAFRANRAYVVGSGQIPRSGRLSESEYQKALDRLVINRYKVLLTRGRLGTFVYIEDEATREAFSRHWKDLVVA